MCGLSARTAPMEAIPMRLTPRDPRETGREYALRTIKDNIVRLELAPGSFVSENELAAEMGLSRTPVREALIELAKVKIIEITPQKRSVVAYIDYDMVEEARFMRNVLECAVVELACQKALVSQILQLENNVQLQRFHLEHGNYGGIMELDIQFHELLFQIAQKPQVYTMIQHISIHFDRVRNMALGSVKDMNIVEDHAQIVEALMNRDAEKARTIMEQHLNRYKFDEQAIREAYPQYFHT